MTDRIYMSPPDMSQAEQDAVARAFAGGWIAPLGPEVDGFERELAEVSGRGHAVALASGTAALHLGLLALGVKPGDVVVTSSMTFAATANAIVYVGAEPVFVDSDRSGNISPDLLREAIDAEQQAGRRVAAVVPVDLLGKVVEHDRVDAIAADAGVEVLADAAESLGATYRGKPAGSFGRLAALSFNGNKIITTSGGGALLTDDEDAAKRARYLATQARQPVVHYEHTEIGYNYRLSNLLAALGRAQLERLPRMMERRRQVRIAYKELFAEVPGVEIFGGEDGAGGAVAGTRDNFWLTSILVDPARAGWDRDGLMAALAERQIEARPLWKPMHLQPVFAGNRAYVDGTSEDLFTRGLSLPSGSALTDAQYERVFDAIRDFITSR